MAIKIAVVSREGAASYRVRGYLSAGFGNRLDPFTGQRDFHPGIDISTPQGTRIHDSFIAVNSNEGIWIERSNGTRVEANHVHHAVEQVRAVVAQQAARHDERVALGGQAHPPRRRTDRP